MASVNKVILIGNLGADPELKHTKGGTSVCTLSLATAYKPKDGEEATEWHRVVVWGKRADSCGRYLSKGRQVYIEGRLQTRKWDQDGVTRYTTEVVAQQVTFLGKKGDDSGAGREQAPAPAGGSEWDRRTEDDALPF